MRKFRMKGYPLDKVSRDVKCIAKNGKEKLTH
jgi:hypothetical protein